MWLVHAEHSRLINHLSTAALAVVPHVLSVVVGVGQVQFVFLLLGPGVDGDVRVLDQLRPGHSLLFIVLKAAVQEVKALKRQS